VEQKLLTLLEHMSSPIENHFVPLESVELIFTSVSTIFLLEELEDTKGAIRICISKKNSQHNGQKKK
jgi:hypothetical protein